MVWSCAGSWRADTLLLMSLHVASNTQEFVLASLDFGSGIALRRAAKSLSSLVRVVRGRRGICVRRLRYSVCYLREALQRHTRNMKWSELCLGYHMEKFLKRRRSVPRM